MQNRLSETTNEFSVTKVIRALLWMMLLVFGLLQLLASTSLTVRAEQIPSKQAGEDDGSHIWLHYSNTDDVLDIAYDAVNQIVWAATTGGAVRWDVQLNTYTKYTVLDGLAHNVVYAVVLDRGRNIWFGTRDGVSQLTADGKWITYAELSPHVSHVNDLFVDSQGHVWAGTPYNGVYELVGDQWIEFYDKALKDTGTLRDFAVDENGGLWIGTERGGLVYRTADGEWQVFTPDNSPLPGNEVFSILVAPSGIKWFGLNREGLVQLSSDNSQWMDIPVATEDCDLIFAQIEAVSILAAKIYANRGGFYSKSVPKRLRTVSLQAQNQVVSIRMGGEQVDSFELS